MGQRVGRGHAIVKATARRRGRRFYSSSMPRDTSQCARKHGLRPRSISSQWSFQKEDGGKHCLEAHLTRASLGGQYSI